MEERFGLEYHWLLGPWGQLHVLLKLNATLPLLHIFQWMCTTFMIHVGFCAKLKWYRILWLFCKLDLFGLPNKININCKHRQTGWNQPIVLAHPTYILVDVQNYSFPWHFISFFLHGFDHSQQLLFDHMSRNNITWCPLLSCSILNWHLYITVAPIGVEVQLPGLIFLGLHLRYLAFQSCRPGKINL